MVILEVLIGYNQVTILGYNVITMAEFRERGLKSVIAETQEKIGNNPIYITFDLDSLDSTIAPAVSNLEPSFTGFNMEEAKALLQCVKSKNVIGGDVVCLMPTKDSPNNITAYWLQHPSCLK